MTEIEELRAVVKAQSKILSELLSESVAKPFVQTTDEGCELLDYGLSDLPEKTRREYFRDLIRLFPDYSPGN